jgi:phytoene/squalene synthetase
MNKQHSTAPSITKAASRQTYYTIRFLADRDRVEDAFRAYGYFRWVDDTLDGEAGSCPDRLAFVQQQKTLMETCYRGEFPHLINLQEKMLIELIRHDRDKNSGLQIYIRNMMQVMDFDVRRRGRLISQAQLNEYTRWLATAVTEAMHYFIGHDGYSPRDETRYMAVAAAHIVHMLRDTFDDIQAGYYNIPREILETNHIQPCDVRRNSYRTWVRSRILLARRYFNAGRHYLARVEDPRCRLAGFAYAARFEWLLDTIESEQYQLRPEYSERKSFGTGMRMALDTLNALITWHVAQPARQPVASQSLRKP